MQNRLSDLEDMITGISTGMPQMGCQENIQRAIELYDDPDGAQTRLASGEMTGGHSNQLNYQTKNKVYKGGNYTFL